MITVNDLIKKRGSNPDIRVSPTDTVYRALQLMAENNVGAVMICEDDHMLGIFTERDYCRKIILMGRSSVNTPIQEIMTKKMVTVCLDSTLEECMELMTKYHIRHLPVQEGETSHRPWFPCAMSWRRLSASSKKESTGWRVISWGTITGIKSFIFRQFRAPARAAKIGYKINKTIRKIWPWTDHRTS